MNTKERLLRIKLSERITKRPKYAESIGVTVANNRTGKEDKRNKNTI